ncbi:MAG: DUF1694 domain-containing protein, partial [Fusobacteriaceae bacterium]
MIDNEIRDAQFQTRKKFFQTQAEREKYLQEFKENIIISLNKEEIESGVLYPEIIEAMHEPDAVLLKMRRDIPLKFLKPYIEVAEKIGLRYTLIDALSFVGEVGLVIVSKEAMDNEGNDLAIDSINQKFIEKGLSSAYPKNFGKKICKKHYRLLSEKLPLYRGSFKEFSLIDKIFGQVCPI